MFKKATSIVIASALVISLLSACAQGNNSTETTAKATETKQATTTTAAVTETQKKIGGEILFMTYRDDLLNTNYPKWLEAFKAKYPDVKVNTATSKSYDQDLKIRMSSNDMPDVFTLGTYNYADSYKEQYMLPLDEVFPELVGQWVGNDCNVHQVDKKTYGLIFGSTSFGLAYNKKIFSEMGLTPPKTLDELIATGKKIKATGKIGLAGCLKAAWVSTPYWRVAQARLDDQKATFDKMTASDAPFSVESTYGEMAALLEKLSKSGIMEDDPLSYEWETYLRDFGNGKVGMSFIYSSTPVNYPGRGDGALKLEDIGLVPFPYDNSGGPYTTLLMPDHSLILSNSSKNPEAAKAFYKWHMDELIADYDLATATISAKKGTTTSIPYLEQFGNSEKKTVVSITYPTDFKALLDKAQINFSQQFANIVGGTSLKDEFDKMNAAWKKAKAN